MTASKRERLIVLPIAVAAVGGLAWAGSRGGMVIGTIPLFYLCVALALLIQWVAFVPAYLLRTERFFDLTGSLTYLTVVALAIELGPTPDARSGLLAGLVTVWAARLGAYLFGRIRAEGADRRFDEIRTSFLRFFVAWTLQGVWICFTAGAALAAITSSRSVALGPVAFAGLVLWIAGFGIEVVADRQKSAFRARPANDGKFITTGLWAWSRHPNYFGEIVLWTGVAVIAAPALDGWQYLTLVSPIFVTVLLTRVSGINLLEERADARWGGDPEYESYKDSTPVLVPRPPAWTLVIVSSPTLALAGALSAVSPAASAGQSPTLELEVEGGPAWQTRNDVEVPNDGTATRFDLAELAGVGPWPAGRLYLTWHLSERHGLRLLVAPFSLTETGTAPGPISFAGSSYVAGVPIEATYRFNSYRLSYRWRLHSSEGSAAWLGFTAKVRDASIRLAQGSSASRKDDLGFVPLLHLAGDWRMTPELKLSLDADGLAGGPGRAVDASLKLSYDLDDSWSLRAGYRTVEGGADVESVYSFAWLHYAVFSVAWRR
jgi:steroid 5-alpha reductase family enzyme